MAKLDWVRDEVILALDVYFTDKKTAGNDTHPLVVELSKLLNSLPLFPLSERDKTFRNPDGVGMKISNFLRLDSDYKGVGLKGGSKVDKIVWNEFHQDHDKLHKIALAIRTHYKDLQVTPMETEGDDEMEAPEGRILTALHKRRERSKKLVEKKKKQVLKDKGKLECEVCGFNFHTIYGKLGEGFIECHHDLPVSSLSEDSKTHIKDLRLVCSNCHRMIHRSKPWLSLPFLKSSLQK